MAKKIILTFALVVFLFSLMGCSGVSVGTQQVTEKMDMPSYAKGKLLQVDESDLNALIEDLIGREYIFYVSNTEVSTAEAIAIEIQSEIEENLNNDNWRLQQDWLGFGKYGMSQWQKGDHQLILLTFDSLSSDDVRELNLSYGIDGLNTTETLIMAHLIDVNQKLPDLTSTAEVQSYVETSTAAAQSIAATGTAAARSGQATRTADAYVILSTQTAQAENEASATMMVEQTRSVEATQTEISAAQTAAVTPTATPDPDPTLGLPFEDNFDKGLRPEWRILGIDEPVLVDGMLTATQDGEAVLEIGNSDLQRYTLEFDLNTSGYQGSIVIRFTPIRSLNISESGLNWYEFKGDNWERTSEHTSTNIEWGWSGTYFRLTIVRDGNYYEFYRDGSLEHTMKYGDPSGSKLYIRIVDNDIAIDNLTITE